MIETIIRVLLKLGLGFLSSSQKRKVFRSVIRRRVLEAYLQDLVHDADVELYRHVSISLPEHKELLLEVRKDVLNKIRRGYDKDRLKKLVRDLVVLIK